MEDHMIDIKPYVDNRNILDLIGKCLFNPSKDKINEVVNSYLSNDNYLLLGHKVDNEFVGYIGLDLTNPSKTVINHIAVKEERRNTGIGRNMINSCLLDYEISEIEVETDNDALDFYKKLGFNVVNTEYKYDNVKRYTLKLNIDKQFRIKTLQEYIKAKDFNPAQRHNYFLKLIEEVGELSEVIRKNRRMEGNEGIKGTIEEELYDVLYYVLALANTYEINLEECFLKKEELNKRKY